MNIGILIAVISVLLLVVLIFALLIFSYKKRNVIFKKIADHFQLRFEDVKGVKILNQEFPSANGHIERMPVNVDMYVVRTGNSYVEYGRITFTLKGTNHKDLCITKENFFRKMGKLIGMQDIIIGKPDMDDYFIIKSSDENYAKYVLNSAVCSYIKQMSFKGSLNVANGQLIYTEVGIPRNEKKLKRFYSNVESLVKVAKEMK